MTTTAEGKIALVAGATRGAGRQIAVQLGAAGATVYATGRSSRAGRSELDRPETIEETAELVTAAGGTGIAVRVDHLVPEQVRDLVARIDAEQGRLDVLVNDIWGGDPLITWEKPVWEQPLDAGLRTLRLAIDTHIITSHFALPLLIRRPGGLVVEIGDGTRAYNDDALPAVGLLRPGEGVGEPARVQLGARAGTARVHRRGAHPGLDPLRGDAGALRGDRGRPGATARRRTRTSLISETPAFVGRAVAALAAAEDRARWNQASVSSRRAGPGVRLHRPRRQPAGRLRATHRGGGRGRPADVTGYR